MPDEIREHDEQLVNRAIDLLRSRFDSVQVYGGKDSNTIAGSWGYGNWYARYGQVHEWVENGGAMSPRGVDTEGDDDPDT